MSDAIYGLKTLLTNALESKGLLPNSFTVKSPERGSKIRSEERRVGKEC